MKIYVVKYALSRGILVKEVLINDKNGIAISNNGYVEYYLVKEYVKTWDEAVILAEEMRLKKIKNLQKQLKKLEAMTFNKEK